MQFCALFYLRSVAVCLRPTGRGMCYLNQPRSCGFRKNPKNGRQRSLGPVVSWLYAVGAGCDSFLLVDCTFTASASMQCFSVHIRRFHLEWDPQTVVTERYASGIQCQRSAVVGEVADYCRCFATMRGFRLRCCYSEGERKSGCSRLIHFRLLATGAVQCS